jgi:hypothetical protein
MAVLQEAFMQLDPCVHPQKKQPKEIRAHTHKTTRKTPQQAFLSPVDARQIFQQSLLFFTIGCIDAWSLSDPSPRTPSQAALACFVNGSRRGGSQMTY